MSKQLWDGTKKPFDAPCKCGAETLFMEGVIDPDGPQVYIFCEKCSFRQPMISRGLLSQRELDLCMERARQLGLTDPPVCCTP